MDTGSDNCIFAVTAIEEELKNFSGLRKSVPIIDGKDLEENGKAVEVFSPADLSLKVGEVVFATEKQVLESLSAAQRGFKRWQFSAVEERAVILEKAADLIEKERGKFFTLLIRECGKVISDAVAEVKKTTSLLRYYAALARKELIEPIKLPGPSGEENYMYFESRGVFVCISPWNFPLAIFLGPVAAALVTGNAVVAKPAEQTSIVAYEAVKLLYRAGVPRDVLHFIPGWGEVLGETLVNSDQIAGVVFTGSTE
ncbi:aldehyde dehydrogenase family protein, partial [Candidatus Anaplasma sp. TIGMIC]|uniref:aldehyde dehydrogenase family protein n=1 Tax=Candidatus Anaplasma sp. TIGMIC TaxID=3020713 RepID=UPI00232EE377